MVAVIRNVDLDLQTLYNIKKKKKKKKKEERRKKKRSKKKQSDWVEDTGVRGRLVRLRRLWALGFGRLSMSFVVKKERRSEGAKERRRMGREQEGVEGILLSGTEYQDVTSSALATVSFP